jgi:GNAT superfamily N-acetyltransferase
MKLSREEQILREPELWEVTKACYSGVEIPLRSLFTQCVYGGDVWVETNPASVGNKIIAYALVTGQEMNSPVLRSIAVLPNFRRIGRGERLLNEITDYYKKTGKTSIVLHCKVDNPAQTLYFKKGYRVTSLLRNYYRPEGDGLEMRKIL